MRTPTNSSAELIVSLQQSNEVLAHKLATAQTSYTQFTSETQSQIDKNIEIIATLEPVAEWADAPPTPAP